MADFTWQEVLDYTGGEWSGGPPDGSGVSSISTDSRTVQAGDLFIALSGENFDAHNFLEQVAEAGAAAAIVSRPVETDIPTLQVEDTLTAYQQLSKEHRLRFKDLFVVGITGSCGKTSSKEIISSVLQAHFGQDAVLTTRGNTNNQIGVPQNLLRLTADHRAAVLEMGTNMHGEIAVLTNMVLPDVAVITNVGPVHLEGLGDLDGVAREKSSIFRGLRDGGRAVLGAGLATNPIVRAALPGDVTTVGLDGEADIVIDYLGSDLRSSHFRTHLPGGESLDVTWGMRGQHMALNAAAAVAIADQLGIDHETIIAGLHSCRMPGMRMEISEVDGVTWINDAYNANPSSVKAMINWLAEAPNEKGKYVLVLGDMLELGTDAEALHKEVLDYAETTMPDATVLAFGPIMDTVTTDGSFTDIAELQSHVEGILDTGDRIALKGSRGMALERLLPR